MTEAVAISDEWRTAQTCQIRDEYKSSAADRGGPTTEVEKNTHTPTKKNKSRRINSQVELIFFWKERERKSAKEAIWFIEMLQKLNDSSSRIEHV